MSTICLNMIVKNEAHIIQSTLANICDHVPIDYWVISDTGSEDATPALIEEFFVQRGIPGELHRDTWVDFATNRTQALRYCQGKADYVLFFDADDLIEGQLRIPSQLDLDGYDLTITNEAGTVRYQRPLLVKNEPRIRWRGVLHEFVEFPAGSLTGRLDGDYRVISRRRGARSQNPDLYLHDAQVFEQALQRGQDPDLTPRYQFYCAQSYRDAGQDDQALVYYQLRAENPDGWLQERYYSYYQMGVILDGQKRTAEALFAYEQGATLDPNRAECWYQLARIHSWQGRYRIAYLYASQAIECELSDVYLFSSPDIFNYWGAYEYALNACRLGHYGEALTGIKTLLEQQQAQLFAYFEPFCAALMTQLRQRPYHEVMTFRRLFTANGLDNYVHELDAQSI